MVRSAARLLVNGWMREQAGIPSVFLFVIDRGTQKGGTVNCFQVCFRIENVPLPYVLADISVWNDGRVEVTRDRRKNLAEFIPQPDEFLSPSILRVSHVYIDAVCHFLEAVWNNDFEKPDWFRGVEVCPHGVSGRAPTDARVRIEVKDRTRDIYIKVLTSNTYKARYMEHFGKKVCKKNILLLIKPEKTHDEIRKELFKEVLERI